MRNARGRRILHGFGRILLSATEAAALTTRLAGAVAAEKGGQRGVRALRTPFSLITTFCSGVFASTVAKLTTPQERPRSCRTSRKGLRMPTDLAVPLVSLLARQLLRTWTSGRLSFAHQLLPESFFCSVAFFPAKITVVNRSPSFPMRSLPHPARIQTLPRRWVPPGHAREAWLMFAAFIGCGESCITPSLFRDLPLGGT